MTEIRTGSGDPGQKRVLWKMVRWAELNLFRIPFVLLVVSVLRLLAFLPWFSWEYEED